MLFYPLLLITLSLSESYQLKEAKENLLDLLRRSINNKVNNGVKIKSSAMRYFQETDNRTKQVLKAANIVPERRVKTNLTNLEPTEHPWLQRRPRNGVKFRRQYKMTYSSESSVRETSSSSEMQRWKEDFDIEWNNKKMVAIKDIANAKKANPVNMVAARPWAVPCGDPDKPEWDWGTCVTVMECDSEFRIWRGDANCKTATEFVCCAIQQTPFDLYQGLDMSFIHSSDSSTYDEKIKPKGSKEMKRLKRIRQKTRIKKKRFRRKQQIKKKIRRIARQIRKELNRAFRNASDSRKQETKKVKDLIKTLKKKFMYDRQTAQDVLNIDCLNIDNELHHNLDNVKQLNFDFLMNKTFRDVLKNKTDIFSKSLRADKMPSKKAQNQLKIKTGQSQELTKQPIESEQLKKTQQGTKQTGQMDKLVGRARDLGEQSQELSGQQQNLGEIPQEFADQQQYLAEHQQNLANVQPDIPVEQQDLAEQSQELTGQQQEFARQQHDSVEQQQALVEQYQELAGQQDLQGKSSELTKQQKALADKSPEITGQQQVLTGDPLELKGRQDLTEDSGELKGNPKDLTRQLSKNLMAQLKLHPPPMRRSGGVIRKRKKTKRQDYMEYDIEYGALYF